MNGYKAVGIVGRQGIRGARKGHTINSSVRSPIFRDFFESNAHFIAHGLSLRRNFMLHFLNTMEYILVLFED